MAAFQTNILPPRAVPQAVAPLPAAPAIPAGTFLPGTKVQVGSHRVVIDKYLSEGGFAHVYVVTLPRPVDGSAKAVLKRVAVPGKDHLANMRNEVETMKRLRGHKHIVKYIDSHASSLKNGGYEVFLLMEWCDGGGLIDFMNTRLQNRLTEPEIIKIFTDVADGVACMHYLKPALLHRDLKVENVLISTNGSTRTFKLCDFGSAAPARPAATTAAEGRLIEDDVKRHTTLQYRSPEMIDVYRKQPIDEKSDIWALGCFLYKLCYYTTPFEAVGQNAILNASFKYPGYPRFSDELKLLVATMLQEQPSRRPNIYQVLAKASKLDGRPLTIRDIYSNRAHSEDNRAKTSDISATSEPRTGASLAPPAHELPRAIPDVEPMRRGRPTKPMSHHTSAKPSPSPLRMVDHSDAFANLDGGAGADELSSRFPRLEEFSLLNDQGSKFAFQPAAEMPAGKSDNDLAKRVTEALADDAFRRPASPPKPALLSSSKVLETRQSNGLQKKKSAETTNARASPASFDPATAGSKTTSTAVGSSPPLRPMSIQVSKKPIWKVPEKLENPVRASSITQASSQTKPILAKDRGGSRLANLLQQDAVGSQLSHDEEAISPTSSRPSLEGARPLLRDLSSDVKRSKSLNVRNRPVSVNIASARPTHINDREIKKIDEARIADIAADMAPLTHAVSENSNTNIKSDIEFLRAREEEERERHKHMKRLSGSKGHHQKRSSLPSVALSGTKNLLQGRFGEAFRKFETAGGERSHNQQHDRTPPHSPTAEEHHILTPIAGSEATDLSDDRRGLDETEELPPELRRELEKQKLEAEERRVERAAAEYRQRVAGKTSAPPLISTKAASIQNRVQSLLNQNDRSPSKTATGYGRFTAETLQSEPTPLPDQRDSKPISAPASAIDLQAQGRMQRPMAPPKPQVLRTGTNEAVSLQKQQQTLPPDNWEDDFQKKYPDLSGVDAQTLPLVERHRQQLRMKEI
ncbi:Ark- serine/threonine protein kinase [Lithohypha guttulata]|nr:Ark- serine/threonine protein kinase [Lithohypha guttulata]